MRLLQGILAGVEDERLYFSPTALIVDGSSCMRARP
jgi:hypothetical protein